MSFLVASEDSKDRRRDIKIDGPVIAQRGLDTTGVARIFRISRFRMLNREPRGVVLRYIW